jgi:hypothetical protein
MQQQNGALIQKGQAAVAADAIATILFFLINQFTQVEIPAAVASAVVVLLTLAMIYFTPPSERDGIENARNQ